jgi:hypothetical protein
MKEDRMNAEQFRGLKGRYNYDHWRENNTLAEKLFIWNFFFKGDEFPNWQPYRMRELGPAPAGEGALVEGEEAGEAPRLVQSLWRPSTGSPGAAFSVDDYECASLAAAHELLVRILGRFQSPLVTRQAEPSVGDVTFVHPGNSIILFARANHVIVIRSIGGTPILVSDLAGQLDQELIAKPPAPAGRLGPSLRGLAPAAAEVEVGSQVPLEIEAAQVSGQPVMYKFFSGAGEVIAREGRLLYQPAVPGEQDLEVYAVAPDRGVGTGRIQFTVRQPPNDG